VTGDLIEGIRVRCFRRGTSSGPMVYTYTAVFVGYETADPSFIHAIEIEDRGGALIVDVCDVQFGPQIGGERPFAELPEHIQRRVAEECAFMRDTRDATRKLSARLKAKQIKRNPQ
jgi:hypothetical protein